MFRSIIAVGDKLWFTSQTERGAEVTWRCGDGTLAGSDRLPGGNAVRREEAPAKVGEILYFTAVTPEGGSELFRSDGTGAMRRCARSRPRCPPRLTRMASVT